jgi:hypothetical protein
MVDNDRGRVLEKLLNDGWTYHDSKSGHLARELEAAALDGVAPDRLVTFLHLSTHTIGEHLGDWPRALALGKRVLDGHTPDARTAKAWGRLRAAALLAGEVVEAAGLELSYLKAAGDNVGAALLDMHLMLVNALVGCKRAGEGARLYRSALDLIGQVGRSTLVDRTVAVASNNIGWELYEMSSRTADDDALMKLAADTSLEFWLKCGDWINEERGLYLKALVANVTGHPDVALTHADAALAIINANGERPLDAARLHLARAASFAVLDDTGGRARAIADADAAAAKLTATDLKERYAVARARTIAGLP